MRARVFTGPNGFALKTELNRIKDDFIKKYGELSVETIDGEESSFEQISAAIESAPFLASEKLVIVHSLSANKEANERIEDLILAAEKANELIVIESKLDKRSSYYKYLKKNTDVNEFNEFDEGNLADWLTSEAKKRDARLSSADAYYLLRRVGVNQERLSNELKKLIDFDKQITRESIDLLSEASPQATIFNLLDSAFEGNKEKMLRLYDEQRTQGEEPLKIFAMLSWQLHLVALVDSADERTDSEIMRLSGLKPFTLSKSKSIARRMGRSKITSVLDQMINVDKQLKTSSVDADDALKNLLLSIS